MYPKDPNKGDRFDEVWKIVQESGMHCQVVDSPTFTTAVDPHNPEAGNVTLANHTTRYVGGGAYSRMRTFLSEIKEKGATAVYLYKAWYDDEGPGTVWVRWCYKK